MSDLDRVSTWLREHWPGPPRPVVLTDEEVRDVEMHAGHDTLDVTTYRDARRMMLCRRCCVTFSAGSL